MLSHQKQHNAFCPDRTSTFIDYEQASQWFDLNIGGLSSQEFEADALQMRLRSVFDSEVPLGTIPEQHL